MPRDQQTKLLNLIEKINNKMDEEIGDYHSIMSQLEYLGSMEIMSALTGEQIASQEDHSRLQLELQDKGIKPEDIEDLQSWYVERKVKWRNRMARLFNIQQNYQISCLEKFRIEVAGSEVDVWRPTRTAPLQMTEDDKIYLMGHKDYYIGLWTQHCDYWDLPMYQLSWSDETSTDETEPKRTWKQINSSFLRLQSTFYTWAFLFINEQDGNLNLLIGNGTDYASPSAETNVISPEPTKLGA